MKTRALQSLITKVSTVAPLIAKALVEVSLLKIGKNLDSATSADLLRQLRSEIDPALSANMGGVNSIFLTGAGTALFDAEDRLLSANPHARKLFARVTGELEGISPEGFRTLEDAGFLRSFARLGEFELREFFSERLNGAFNVLNCRLPEGGAGRVFVLIQDFTLRHEIENELLHNDRELRESIERRKQLEDMIVNSSRMAVLGEVAGGIAHEVNTPLGVMLMLTDQLDRFRKTGGMAPEEAERLSGISERIRKQVDRVTAIIRSVSRISHGGEPEPLRPAKLGEILCDAVSLCQTRARRAGATVLCPQLPDQLLVSCRSVELTQVLVNLLGNAMDAVHAASSKWVRISVQDLGASVEVSVTDSGPGIAAENRTKIFRAFFTTKAVGAGTGLGLSLSKKILQGHGSDLVLDTESAQTRFVFALAKG